MYPGTSIIEYPKQNSQDDSNEYNLNTLEQNADEFLEPSSKKLHESIDTSSLSNNEKSTSIFLYFRNPSNFDSDLA